MIKKNWSKFGKVWKDPVLSPIISAGIMALILYTWNWFYKTDAVKPENSNPSSFTEYPSKPSDTSNVRADNAEVRHLPSKNVSKSKSEHRNTSSKNDNLSRVTLEDEKQESTFNKPEDKKESDTAVIQPKQPMKIYTPNVAKESMKETYCYDAHKSYQYTSCCFINLTGERLILEKYYGYWISPEYTNLLVDVQSKSCTEKLLVDYYGQSEIRDFKFYFKTESGKQCKYPIVIRLEKCVETTIEITSSQLGLQ